MIERAPIETAGDRVSAWAQAAEAELYTRRSAHPGLKPNLRRSRGRIAVVTDAASALPLSPGTRRPALGVLGAQIEMVPIPVMIDQHRADPHRGDAQIYPQDSAELSRDLPLALAQGLPVRTSRPSPGLLAETYRRLQAAGFAGVVSVHLSGKLSGTVDAATLAAEQVQIPVVVVDSGQAGLALGQSVIEAAITARLGGGLQQTVEAAQAVAAHACTLFAVPSLEQLRRGGRINRLASIFGTLMRVKPLLGLRGGEIVLIERPHSMARAAQRLQEIAIEEATAMSDGARIGVHCVGNPGQGIALAADLQGHSVQPVPVVDLPPGLAAHLGLGALGVSITPVG